MKLNQQTRFAHPVLAPDTGDYAAGEFTFALDVAEAPEKGEVTFKYKINLAQPDLHLLIESDKAAVGIFVRCGETYFSHLIPLGLADGQFAFDPGTLLGRVSVRPMIWSRSAVQAYSLANCHAEFGGGSMDFTRGSVLALADEITLHVGRDKLAQMETIFTIAMSEDLSDNTLSVDLDADRIRVLVAKNIYETVNRLRDLPHGRPIILNSVYLPAVIQVLDSLKDGGATYEGRRWYKVFDAKCDFLTINRTTPDLWPDAQKMLRGPFGEIHKNIATLEG